MGTEHCEIELEFLGPLHGADAGYAAEAQDHAVEVMQVLGFHDELDDGFAGFFALDFDAADVGVVV